MRLKNPAQCQNRISPYIKLKEVGIGEARWIGGFWGEKFEKCWKVMIPNMWRLLSDPNIGHAFTNFLIAAGIEEGVHRGPPWHDGDFYKWLEATAFVYALTRDESLDKLMDYIVGVIARAQRSDGYIHTPVLIKQRYGEKLDEFPHPDHFVTYNFGHLMTAASIHYLATGKRALLDIAEKAASYLYEAYVRNPLKLAKNAICPSHYMGLIDLYRVTGNSRYLELAKKLIDVRDLVKDGTDQNQDRIPLRQHDKIVGHAVRANYLYAGVADLYSEIGDESLLNMLVKVWENMVYTKMYITGACGALYDGASPYGGEVHEEIQLIHQAYGLEYQLPNAIAHNESCAAVGNVLWSWRMFKIFGEARFMDVVELTLYNAILASISIDGTKFFYTNTLRQLPLPYKLRWSRQREPYISCFCCPPNIVRTIAQSIRYAYSISQEGIWVNLYGDSELHTSLDDSKVSLKQESKYPWDDYIKIVLEHVSNKEFTLFLRIPWWTNYYLIKVNGEKISEGSEGGMYYPVKRIWSKGDTVELYLNLKPRLVEAHPLVEELRNQVAVMYGPIVYCLESVDLPKDVRIYEVYIPRNVELIPTHINIGGENMVALEGKLRVYRAGSWEKKLYREYTLRESEVIETKLIPHYAWGNRGPSEMTVWIPLD